MGTKTQRYLVSFKGRGLFGNTGSIGIGYLTGFKNRYEHLISSKRGIKQELDRDKWITYANFSDMYNHIYDDMVDAGLAHTYD